MGIRYELEKAERDAWQATDIERALALKGLLFQYEGLVVSGVVKDPKEGVQLPLEQTLSESTLPDISSQAGQRHLLTKNP